MVAKQKVLAIVLAGGRGSRLSPLTDERAKPAVPFLGNYHLIDFSLSNLVNSGLSDVWVIEQYMPHRLNDHLSGGRPWDLDRTRGGLVVMPPFSGPTQQDGEFASGNAHALAQHAHLIREFGPDVVLVLSADHIYRCNFTEVIEAHQQFGASVTMVTTDLPDPAEATRFGNVQADAQGRVKHFAYKPQEPLGRTVTAEIFVYDTGVLLRTLRELERQGSLGDYGEELLPALVARGDAYAFPLSGYWKDVGTLQAYWQAHRDFLDGHGFALDAPEWPLITTSLTSPPARLQKGAVLEDALVCGGAVVAGEVRRSVIGPGAVVERGALVQDSVVQTGAVIRAGAQVRRSIVDEEAVVGAAASVGGQGTRSRLSVVGASARVGPGVTVPAGHFVAARSQVSAGKEGRKIRPLEMDEQGKRKGS